MGTFSSIKKYSKPSLELEERISYLNNQLAKTGMLSERMTTDALYQQGEYVPERGTDHTAEFEDAPEYSSGGSKLLGTQNFTSNQFASIRRQFPLYTSRSGWKWIYISNVFRAPWGNNINSFGETGGIGGYYTSMPDARLIAGGSVIRTSDPVVGYTTRYHPNNYPATAPLQANLDDPDYLPVFDRNNKNKKRGPKDPWEELKKRLKAGKEWMDYMMDKRFRGKRKRMVELLGKAGEKALGKFGELMGFVEDKIEELVGDSLDKAVGTASAGATLGAFWDQQEGNVNYNKNNPYEVPYGQTQKQNISNAFDKALDYTDNMGFDLRGKIDRGEKFTQQEIDFLNQKMNFEFGSTTPEGFGFYRTFGKFSPNLEITKNDNGGYDIKDNYVFDNLNDFEGGQIEIGGVKFGPGVKGEYYARKDRGDIDFYDKEPTQAGAKRIGSIKQMFIKASLPPSSSMKEELTLEDIERQLILEELEYDQLIEKLEKQSCFTKQEQTYKTIKRVSSATKDPSPILETKIIQTEQKSPSRFLAKEKRENTSRARWLKGA